MTQPDNPDFNRFFATTWQDLLTRTEVPGFTGQVSWDRRAAYLLWCMGTHFDAETPWNWLDVLEGYVAPPRQPVGSPASLMAPVIGRLPRDAAVSINFNSKDYPDGH